MHRIALLIVLGCCASPVRAVGDTAMLSKADLHRLGTLKIGEARTQSVPDGFGGAADVAFRRIEVYAPGAKVIAITPQGEQALSPSPRIHLVGKNADGSVRVQMSFDPGFGHLVGYGTKGGQREFVLGLEKNGDGALLRARPAEDALPPGVKLEYMDNVDSLESPLDAAARPLAGLAFPIQSAAVNAMRVATLAIDTDNEFMSERFANNTAQANAWIADYVASMSATYETDLNVRLQVGQVILRTTSDPYSAVPDINGSAHRPQLDEFGNYWEANYNNVARSFAMLLSGKSTNGNAASGIAWINSYCRKPSLGGAYSFNQVFTNPLVPVFPSAKLSAHELGHNFGAYHTHCANAATGIGPANINTIDQCYNRDASSGCYSGTVSCPTSGPGAPAGTLMSYCHFSSVSCGSSVAQFHPAHVAYLSTLVAQNTPSCLVPDTDTIFADGFE